MQQNKPVNPSYFDTAQRLAKERGGVHMNQYDNDGNWRAHYQTTAPELFEQMDQKIDYIFIGAGTGGTFTGIGKYARDNFPNTKIVCIDPHGSILALPESLNTPDKLYKIEGIGQSKIAKAMDRSVAHHWIKTDDLEGFIWAKKLMKEEGLFVGGSCGSAVSGMVRWLKENNLADKPDLR